MWIKFCLNELIIDFYVLVVINVIFIYICNISCIFCVLIIIIINVCLFYFFVFDYLLNDLKILICLVKCFFGDLFGL